MTAPGIDWSRLSRGIFWMGIGVFLLLNTLEKLPWSIWTDALAYWPLLLVAGGLKLVLDRSRQPWMVFVSPLLVLGTLAAVALGTPPEPSGERLPLQADRPEATERWLLGGTVTFATLEVNAGDLPEQQLLEGTVISRQEPSVRTSQSNGQARVRLEGARHQHVILLPKRNERWELTVADDLPLELDLELAFDHGEIDLSGIDVTSVDLHGAFNSLRLRLGPPTREVRVNVEGAFNALTLVVPAEVPVRTNTDGFLNMIDRRHDPPALGGAGYRLRVDGAFSRTTVRSE
jgi:hypothetical protein